jgi:enoyl-CoA hydratase/carnithine racemase
VLALCCDYRVMASGPFAIGLNETQVGLVAPEGIQHLLRRMVGPYRAERLLVAGELVDAERALALGLVDELVEVEHVATRARVWLEQLLALPRQPMLVTRRIARADLVAALAPERIGLDRFVDAWFAPDTQAALRALVAKLGK